MNFAKEGLVVDPAEDPVDDPVEDPVEAEAASFDLGYMGQLQVEQAAVSEMEHTGLALVVAGLPVAGIELVMFD